MGLFGKNYISKNKINIQKGNNTFICLGEAAFTSGVNHKYTSVCEGFKDPNLLSENISP